MPKSKVIVLGSGTSTGVPVVGCDCETCLSDNPKDHRLRTSIYISLEIGNKKPLGLLIDSPPDIRTQLLRSNITNVDGVLFTHTHADHVNGIDDLRVFNFMSRQELPIYGSPSTIKALKATFPYVFTTDPSYEGGSPPKLAPTVIEHDVSFALDGVEVMPIELEHGKTIVTGYRVHDFAYLPDCSFIPESSLEKLSGLSVLIIDGLRDRPHKTHFTQQEAVEVIEKLKPKKSFLTHISHEVLHERRQAEIASWTNLDVSLAYDQLEIDF